jgi:hypothetical protein
VFVHFADNNKLRVFLDYLEAIDEYHYAEINKAKGLQKDVFLPVADTTVNMAFSIAEFHELKRIIHDFLNGAKNAPAKGSCLKSTRFRLRMIKYEHIS